jgi:predicted membrane protein
MLLSILLLFQQCEMIFYNSGEFASEIIAETVLLRLRTLHYQLIFCPFRAILEAATLTLPVG